LDQKLLKFPVEYKFKGRRQALLILAESWDDAEDRIAAIKNTLTPPRHA
jgi:hypothetical protein